MWASRETFPSWVQWALGDGWMRGKSLFIYPSVTLTERLGSFKPHWLWIRTSTQKCKSWAGRSHWTPKLKQEAGLRVWSESIYYHATPCQLLGNAYLYIPFLFQPESRTAWNSPWRSIHYCGWEIFNISLAETNESNRKKGISLKIWPQN